MFADDTNMFFSGNSQSLLEKTINDELMLINEWFQVNLLSLNVSKTTYIIFKTSRKRDIDLNCFIQNSKLLRQYDTKFLGVIISSDLKWNKHISVVIAKTSKSLGIISKARHLVPQHTTRMLYMTLVEPYFNYCNIVWASSKKTTYLDKLLRIQKKYCRLITFSSYTEPSKKLFTQLNILTIYSIHKIQLATHMYKILHKIIPDHSTFSFPQNSSIHAHNTRFNQMLLISYSRTKLRNDTLRFQGPELWNSEFTSIPLW